MREHVRRWKFPISHIAEVFRRVDPLALQNALRTVVNLKPDDHGVTIEQHEHSAFAMSSIGG